MFEIEHGEDEGEGECDDDEDEHDQKDVERCTRSMQILTFKDVEESLNTFSGDDKKNVCHWLREFEEMARVCAWNDVQMVIYARRLLRGSAKMFVNYEECCHSWSEMSRALRSEFSQVVDAQGPQRVVSTN